MPPESLSKPLLPAAFVKKLRTDPMMAGYESCSFTQEGHDKRLILFHSPVSALPARFLVDVDLCTPDPIAGDAHEKVKLTVLQCAAVDGDPIWACELIKLGCPIDKKCKGKTPLLLALHLGLDHYYSDQAQRLFPNSKQTAAIHRHLFIARTLIEQHADLEIAENGVNALLVACILARHGHWDMVSLLLQHGANPSLLPVTIPLDLNHHVEGPVFPSVAMKSRFMALVQSFSGRSRPARKCPCFSGQSLADCHGGSKATPYPMDYICFCGSGRTFRKCCARLPMGTYTEEKWSYNDQRMTVATSTEHIQKCDSKWTQICDAHLPLTNNPTRAAKGEYVLTADEQTTLSRAREGARLDTFKWIAKDMCANGSLDPAYGYALQKSRHCLLAYDSFFAIIQCY